MQKLHFDEEGKQAKAGLEDFKTQGKRLYLDKAAEKGAQRSTGKH